MLKRKRKAAVAVPVVDEAYSCIGFAGGQDMFSLVESSIALIPSK